MRTCDSKPSETGTRGHSDPMDVDAINSLASGTGKGSGSSSSRDGRFKCGGAHLQRDCNVHASTQRQWQERQTEQVMVHKVLAKERARKARGTENSKDHSKSPKVPQVRTRVQTSKSGSSGLENPKSERSSETQESAQT